jgi:hypothetical protein
MALASTYFLCNNLKDSDLYKKNKLADHINGETCAVSQNPFPFPLSLFNQSPFSFGIFGLGNHFK